MESKTISYSFIVIGPPNTGKSSISSRLVQNKFSKEYKQKSGSELTVKNFDFGTKKIQCAIMTMHGNEKIKPMVVKQFNKSNGIFVVFNLAKKETFDQIDSYIKEAKQYINENTKFIIAGNFQDLDKERQVKIEEIKEKATKLGFQYVEISAATGNGVNEAFKLMCETIIGEKLPDPIAQSIAVQPKKEESKKSISKKVEASKKK